MNHAERRGQCKSEDERRTRKTTTQVEKRCESMDKRQLLAVAAVPAVLAFGALGFTQQGNAQNANTAASQAQRTQQAEEQEAKGPDRDSIEQGGGNQVEDGKPDLPGAAAEDGD
jgi:uncharacterized protein HemX